MNLMEDLTMDYTEITPQYFVKHTERVQPVPVGETIKRGLARTDWTYFMVNQIGIAPYSWQSMFVDAIYDGQKVMACTSRQIGKTFGLAGFALHACTYNTIKIQPDNRTHIVIISASEEQSKKIIADIRKLMQIGDERVLRLTNGKIKNFFSNMIAKDKSNNKSAITFKDGCDIISLPPTDRARGYTGSIVLIDEAAFIEDEDIYENIIKHIVSKTGNRIVMTSTPNGQQGFFFKYFDPEKTIDNNPFKKIWISYKQLYMDDGKLVYERDKEYEMAVALGNEKKFQQEQLALFTSAQSAFLDSDVVDDCVNQETQQLESFDQPCDLAVDFGKVVSRTVICISAIDNDGNINLLYDYEYPPENDISLMDDIEDLRKRFNIQRVIFEDCPASNLQQQQAREKGWNLVVFNPSKDKIKKYFDMRASFKRELINIYPEAKELIRQLKGLVQEEGVRTTKIHKGSGLRDDVADAFMMSIFFYTGSEENKVKMIDWDDYDG